MSNNLTNQQPPVMTLQQFNGVGHLRCQHGTVWECTFSLARLLNGRLQVTVVPNVKRGSSKRRSWTGQCAPFWIEGVDEQDNQVSVTDVHFTRSVFSEYDTLIGYATSTRRSKEESTSDTVAIHFELTNFRFISLHSVTVQIGDSTIEIERFGRHWKVEEHGSAYQHTGVSAYLQFQDVPLPEQERVIKCAHGIAELLSVAQRGYVFLAAQHKYDPEGHWLQSQFDEPSFTRRKWPRALIPDNVLEEFLVTAYPNLTAKYQSLELANVIDHYLQALTLRSLWPSSLGIFTAMETLRAAFYHQPEAVEDRKYEFWVVPDDAFKSNTGLFDELIELLGNHFPRFRSLSGSERQALKAQIRNLNRRSYKTQLRRMLDQFGVDYQRRELQPFIDIRNRIIHYGTPAHSDVPTAEYDVRTSKASREISDATSLFERALLAVLGYTGPRELFNAEEGRTYL